MRINSCTDIKGKLIKQNKITTWASGVSSNHEAYHSGNLPHTPKLTSSSHVHPFGIKNPKNHCFINVILQVIYSVLRSTQQQQKNIYVYK